VQDPIPIAALIPDAISPANCLWVVGQFPITRIYLHWPTGSDQRVRTFIENSGLANADSANRRFQTTRYASQDSKRVGVRIWTLAAENDHPL
jgi:hypothetical protein